MIRFSLLLALAATAFSVHAAHHGSTFQNTCSNIEFAYQGNNASITAMCLTSNGTPNSSSILIDGVGNHDGKLTMEGTGASTFQRSCGNIQILIDGPDVTLYAVCRRANGKFLESSMPLEGIKNVNGNLSN